MEYTAKTIIIDCVDSIDTSYMGLDKVLFLDALGDIIPMTTSDFIADATTDDGNGYAPEDAFVSDGSNVWNTTYENVTNQRLICTFNTSLTFSGIAIINEATYAVINALIYTSSIAVTSVVFGADVSNYDLIWDGEFDPYNSNDTLADRTLTLKSIVSVTAEPFGLSGSLSAWATPSVFLIPSEIFELSGPLNATAFVGKKVLADPFSLTGTLSAALKISISAEPFEISGSLSATVFAGLRLYLEIFTSTGGLLSSAPIVFSKEFAVVYYIFTLTGNADNTTDIEIPISSFQCRMKNGYPTYLSVVIPQYNYTSEIAARGNGTMKIDMAYKQDGEYLQRETIIQTEIDSVSHDKGAVNKSITLIGYKTETFINKQVILEKSFYRSTRAGKTHYRFAKPNIYLRPGDTVTVGDDVFIADNVTYAISVDSKTMEVAEA